MRSITLKIPPAVPVSAIIQFATDQGLVIERDEDGLVMQKPDICPSTFSDKMLRGVTAELKRT